MMRNSVLCNIHPNEKLVNWHFLEREEGDTVEMSSSWNFPARASPSCEASEPSQAELGYFNFRAETELTILTICMPKKANS